MQPIVGALLSVDLDDAGAPADRAVKRKPPHLPLLVQNEAGYRNLTKLLSAAYLGAEPGDWPHVKADDAGRACRRPDRADRRARRPDQSALLEGQPDGRGALLDRLAAIFGDRLYVELQRHGLAGRTRRRRRAARSRLCQRHSARRHQ